MEVLSGYAVREGFRLRTGVDINPERLEQVAAWGLLERHSDGTWGATTVERLLQIRELGKTVDSYARRVILLNGANVTDTTDRISVPPESLRAAMIDIAPGIQPHLRKMKRVESALRLVFRPDDTTPDGRTLKKGWKPPHREEWVTVLGEPSPELFAQVVGVQYYALGLLKTFDTSSEGYSLGQIPDEEILTLLTIRHIAALSDSEHRYARNEAVTP